MQFKRNKNLKYYFASLTNPLQSRHESLLIRIKFYRGRMNLEDEIASEDEGTGSSENESRAIGKKQAAVGIPARHRVRPVAPPNRGGPLI